MNEFRNGRDRIVDLHRQHKCKSGRSRANICQVEDAVNNDCRISIAQIMTQTGLKSTTVNQILKKDLSLSKRCAKYVPTLLQPPQITRRVAVCDFWTCLHLQAANQGCSMLPSLWTSPGYICMILTASNTPRSGSAPWSPVPKSLTATPWLQAKLWP